jgi:release factor glutamine methyltransferase
VVATELSPGALAVARANAARLGLDVEMLEGDLLDPVSGPLDAVLSNPPYVAAGDLLPRDVGHEPREALFGGEDGLDVIRRLVVAASGVPFLAMEVGAGQAVAVAELVRVGGWRDVETVRDLAGHERVVVGRGNRFAAGESSAEPGPAARG